MDKDNFQLLKNKINYEHKSKEDQLFFDKMFNEIGSIQQYRLFTQYANKSKDDQNRLDNIYYKSLELYTEHFNIKI